MICDIVDDVTSARCTLELHASGTHSDESDPGCVIVFPGPYHPGALCAFAEEVEYFRCGPVVDIPSG